MKVKVKKPKKIKSKEIKPKFRLNTNRIMKMLSFGFLTSLSNNVECNEFAYNDYFDECSKELNFLHNYIFIRLTSEKRYNIIKYYKLAIKNNLNFKTYNDFGVYLFRHSSNKKAIQILKKALEISPNNGIINYNLGVAYLHYKSNKSYKKAMNYFKKAKNKNIAEAYYNYGINSYLGVGIYENDKIAFKNLLISSKLNNKQAIKNIIIMYKNGIGTKIDNKQFKFWKKRLTTLQKLLI